MRILICDDDMFFAETIQKLIEKFFTEKDMRVEAVLCTSAEQVLELLDLTIYQIAFLDVKLEAMNGIRLGQQLKQKNPNILLIYISSYLEFALQGYTVSAFRYLLKNDINKTLSACLEDVYSEMFRKHHFLLVQINRETFRIAYDSIYYLQSSGRKVEVYGAALYNPICTYYGKLSQLPLNMFSEWFLQVAHSTVVNMRYIQKIAAYKVRLDNGVELGISRRIYQKVCGEYLEWKGRYGEG